jgi:hypothetical protein
MQKFLQILTDFFTLQLPTFILGVIKKIQEIVIPIWQELLASRSLSNKFFTANKLALPIIILALLLIAWLDSQEDIIGKLIHFFYFMLFLELAIFCLVFTITFAFAK